MWPLSKSNKKSSSRKQIQIKEVRNGILMLPNNEYRIILETSAVNFELKSSAEQDVMIDTFQNFLNSLPCRIQILVRVREMDVDQYLEKIRLSSKKETEKVYKDQINNYSIFIQKLIAGNKILSRHFYIIVPFNPTENKRDFELIKEQLKLNQDIVSKGMEKLGMQVKVLGTKEILDLFYNFYNFNQAKIQPLQEQTLNEEEGLNYV